MRSWDLHISTRTKENLGLILNILSFVGLTLTAVLAWVYHFLATSWLLMLYLLCLVFLISLAADYLRLKRRISRISASGVRDYYSRYEATFSHGFWDKTRSTYRYLGITGSTFLSELKHWMNTSAHNLQYEFLLLDPESAFLSQVERERLRLSADDDSLQARTAVEKQVTAKRSQIHATVSILESTIPAQNHRVRIKFYDAYPAYWMEILDDRRILMGILSPLRHGPESPLLVLEPKSDYSFYHSMLDQWHRLWSNSKDLQE